jgi:hypothetical protein
MEIDFSINGTDYVVYQENFNELYVNYILCREWILRERTDRGRVLAGKFHIPAHKSGQDVIDHIIKILSNDPDRWDD